MMMKSRRGRGRALNELCDSTLATRKTLCLLVSSGHPRIEEDQHDLRKTICDIDLYWSAAHKKRDTVVTCTKMLSDCCA